jgi:hypothetical protein
MDDILSYESGAERDDCLSPMFGYSTGSSDTSVGFVNKIYIYIYVYIV